MEKMCSRCQRVLPVTSFYKWKYGSDGLCSYCKECSAERARQYYRANTERIAVRVEAYKQANLDKFRERQRRWYKANAEHVKARDAARHAKDPEKYRESRRRLSAAYRARHPQRYREIQAEYRRENPEKLLSIRAKFKANNLEKCRVWSRAYHKANPDKHAAVQRKRRARKRNAGGQHTAEQIKERYSKQQGKCACCKVPLNGKYHADHIIPLSRGGSNDISNIQLLCPPCNLRKNAKDPIEFMQSLGFLL
jgi:5-methylcytosine-specific restriction endonuclease McrA